MKICCDCGEFMDPRSKDRCRECYNIAVRVGDIRSRPPQPDREVHIPPYRAMNAAFVEAMREAHPDREVKLRSVTE